MAALPESPGQPDRYCAGQYHEHAVLIDCEGEAMFGIASLPLRPGRRAVLVVVGGPQYRAGSHRQFTLLARHLAAAGTPVLRFDYRGMGDSPGQPRNFEQVSSDLRSAVDALCRVAGTEDIVLWGLCDGASAALFYAAADPRVSGLVLLNPWLRTGEGLARATLKHYYLSRLLERSFWTKLLSGRFDPRAAASSFARLAAAASGRATPAGTGPSLPQRMLDGLHAFHGRVLLILSGADLTAREFTDTAAGSRRWRKALRSPRVCRRTLDSADHTFARRAWRDKVAAWTDEWIRSW